MDKRIIELAIEALENRKAAVETEIAGLEAAMSKRRGRIAATAKASHPVKARGAVRKPRQQSAVARKAISKRMKAYWAKRRAGKAKA